MDFIACHIFKNISANIYIKSNICFYQRKAPWVQDDIKVLVVIGSEFLFFTRNKKWKFKILQFFLKAKQRIVIYLSYMKAKT